MRIPSRTSSPSVNGHSSSDENSSKANEGLGRQAAARALPATNVAFHDLVGDTRVN